LIAMHVANPQRFSDALDLRRQKCSGEIYDPIPSVIERNRVRRVLDEGMCESHDLPSVLGKPGLSSKLDWLTQTSSEASTERPATEILAVKGQVLEARAPDARFLMSDVSLPPELPGGRNRSLLPDPRWERSAKGRRQRATSATFLTLGLVSATSSVARDISIWR
jgi:hypothetical protein